MKQSIIFVMNRWDSSKGGIQTVNRELLLALARIRPDIECIAIVCFAEKAEVEQAFNNNVTLIHGGEPDKWESVLLSEQVREIEPASVIAVVGHSSFSGNQASLLRDTYFKQACMVQFIHMDPMRTEGLKEAKRDNYVAAREEKQRVELEFAKSADVVFCVGPRLTRVTKDNFRAHRLDHTRVHRIDCGLSADQTVRDAPPEQPTLVCLGRTESTGVKGLDIFARMAGIIDHEWTTDPLTKLRLLKPRFVVRGAENRPESLQEQLLGWAAEMGGAPDIFVRPYTTDKESLNADLRGATAFLMPSREEGFGLVACEAMSFGTPIIVSRQSGIAELILEVGHKSGHDFGTCVVDVAGDAKVVAKRFADVTMPLLIDGVGDEYFYPRLRGHLGSICSWEAGADTFLEVIEAAYQARTNAAVAAAKSLSVDAGGRASVATQVPDSKPTTIESVLAAERDSLMKKQGVIAVGIKQAIVVTVEKGAKPNLPDKIDGFQVVVREVEQVKLTSTEGSSGHDLIVNGERRATVGLFGIDPLGQLFAITVAHAFKSISRDKIEMLLDDRHIPLTVETIEENTDWAILRVGGELAYTPRSFAHRRPGAQVFIEIPSKLVQGSVDSVDITMDIPWNDFGKRRYQNAFEVALEAGVEPGGSGAVVSDQHGEVLGIVIGTMVRDGGAMSALVIDPSSIMDRNNLRPVTIDEMSTQPRIGILLENDEAASAFFERLVRVNRFTRSGRLYFKGATPSGVRVTCTILRELGSINSAIAMTSMLIDNRPDAVFIVSRCGGLRSNQSLGDVVVASEVLVFEPTFASNEFLQIRPYVSVVPMALRHLGLRLAYLGHLGRLHIGPLASVSMVMKAADIDDLKAISRNVAALDTGAAGAILAANAISKDLPVVVVSVISELLTKERQEECHDVSYRAAEVAIEMLTYLRVPRRSKRRTLIVDEPDRHFY